MNNIKTTRRSQADRWIRVGRSVRSAEGSTWRLILSPAKRTGVARHTAGRSLLEIVTKTRSGNPTSRGEKASK